MASRAQAIEKYNQGKIRSALNITKNFKLNVTPEERDAMSRGYECMVHPEIYVQMGYNVDATVEAGVKVMKKVLGIPEPVKVKASARGRKKTASVPDNWVLIMSRPQEGLFAINIQTADIQKAIKTARELGYRFVATVNSYKANRIIDGDSAGAKGVYDNLTGKGISVEGVQRLIKGVLIQEAVDEHNLKEDAFTPVII